MSLWIRLPCDMLADCRAMELGVEAFGLWTRGLLYAKQYMTDGFVPASVMPLVAVGMTPERIESVAESLVQIGLWRRVKKGYQVPAEEWAKWQTTKEEVEALRERRLAKATKAATARWRSGTTATARCPDDARAMLDENAEHAPGHLHVDAHTTDNREQTSEHRDEERKTSSSCPERPADGSRTPSKQQAPNEPVVMDFPAKSGSYALPRSKLVEFAASYCGEDEPAAMQELKHARQWLVDNPGRRKSARRMPGFLGSWLARSNKQGHFAKERAAPVRSATDLWMQPSGNLDGW